MKLRQERRSQIMEAAGRLFARKGFHQTTVDDIVRESGLSKGGVYWHFKSKDDIIAAMLEQLFDQEMAGLQRLVETSGSARERLLELASIVARDIDRMATMQGLAFEFYAVAVRQEDVRVALRTYFNSYHQILATLLQEGFDHEEWRGGGHSAQELARLLLAQFEGLALFWALDAGSFDLKRQCELAVQLVLDSLQSEKEGF